MKNLCAVYPLFAALPQVQAIGLGGSLHAALNDAASDIDLYVFTRADVPLLAREAIVAQMGGASRADLNLNYWGPGNEWYDAATGIEIDVVYFDGEWMTAQVARVLQDCAPSVGYSTCFVATIAGLQVLHDPEGFLAALKAQAAQPYPEPLRRAIVAYNHPMLRGIIPSYFGQIEKALRRDDRVSLNHRVAALLASYFDIVFAVNRRWHPGEKRLLQQVEQCARLPRNCRADVHAVLAAAGSADPDLLLHVNALLDGLDARLREEGVL